MILDRFDGVDYAGNEFSLRTVKFDKRVIFFNCQTELRHPDYNGMCGVVLQRHFTKKQAQRNHKNWLFIFLNDRLPPEWEKRK